MDTLAALVLAVAEEVAPEHTAFAVVVDKELIVPERELVERTEDSG